jgi:hypothetical protein
MDVKAAPKGSQAGTANNEMRTHPNTYNRRAKRASPKKRAEARALFAQQAAETKRQFDSAFSDVEQQLILQRFLCHCTELAALEFTPWTVRQFQMKVEGLETSLANYPKSIENAWQHVYYFLLRAGRDIRLSVFGSSWPKDWIPPVPSKAGPEIDLFVYPCVEIAAALEARRPEFARVAATKLITLLGAQV